MPSQSSYALEALRRKVIAELQKCVRARRREIRQARKAAADTRRAS